MLERIIKELKKHAPFTFFGAITGIVIMFLAKNVSFDVSHKIFYTLHPLHVVLSALVTGSMFKIHHEGKPKIWALILIGYFGSIGIATLSDSIIPYIAETLLNLPNRGIHLGFIDKWWLVNPLAFLGIAIAYFRPRTKFPHAGHVLLSTWASLFHILMAASGMLNWFSSSSSFCF